jgi:hypothetical protein
VRGSGSFINQSQLPVFSFLWRIAEEDWSFLLFAQQLGKKAILNHSRFCEQENERRISMATEQEVKALVVIGFMLVLVLVAVPIYSLWNKTGNRGLLWFIPQFGMLFICLVLFIQLINNQRTVPSAMLSEENSLTIGLMGISWALSMVFMTIGTIRIVKYKTRLN